MVVRGPAATSGATRRRRRLLAAGALLAALVVVAGGGICRFTSVDCRLCALPGRDCAHTELAPGFAQEVVVRGLDFPTSFAFLPDGRIAVGEKDGRVRLVEDGRLLSRPLLDIRDRVNTYSLRGLLALEPDPDFRRTGYLYVLYVSEDGRGPAEAPETVRVERFTVVGDRVPARSSTVVLDGIPADGDQVGGDIAFARDGTMFVATGDGSSETDRRRSLRAQDVNSLAGKLLHVTPAGNGVRTNPFWDGDGAAARSKVWAYGFRNPFRLTLRPESGIPYVADVGWNTSEEIDAVVAGGNYGWPCYEGTARTPGYARFATCAALYERGRSGLRPAVLEYAVDADPRRASVTGGPFYTGRSYPPEYRGAYFFGDWARNSLSYVRPAASGNGFGGRPESFANEANGPVELAVGADGALYYLASKVGELRRIVYKSRS